MADTLYRIQQADQVRFPRKVSRVRAHLRRGLAIGSETSPEITPLGKEVLQVARSDPQFVEPQEGTVGAQNIPEPDEATVARVLALLDGHEAASRIGLHPGRVYSWVELGQAFDFEPNYLGSAGGMVSRPDQDALLLMTHPGGARSIDYGDYWAGKDLIYTGRGKRGDQKRQAQNRDVGDNLKDLFVFEPAGSRLLHFVGHATCVGEWPAQAEDVDGNERSVLRFRLSFDEPPQRFAAEGEAEPREDPRSDPERRPRPFDPGKAPKAPAAPAPNQTPEETQALLEKAVLGHHRLLVALSAWLEGAGWTEVEEIPSAIDLWARRPVDGARVLFEAKTLRDGTESARLRSAVAQLFEYRFFHGDSSDRLCLVCDRPISDRRSRFLESLEIAVLWRDGDTFSPGSANASGLISALPSSTS